LTGSAAANQLGGVLPDQRACHLGAGYDSGPTRQALSELGFTGQIARKGVPAPIQAGRRWPVDAPTPA
jgi:IS5 family transposase